MSQSESVRFLRGVARAYGGAVIFALPLLMTMEMWHLGFHMPPLRQAILLLLTFPLLFGLSHYAGFEVTVDWQDDVVDSFVAVGVGASASLAILMLIGAVTRDMTYDEVVGKVALQTVPASIGALLSQSQFGQHIEEQKRREVGYWGGLFLMAVGAMFLAWNIAPTEEIILIAYTISLKQALVLALLSLAIIHAFMFALEFHGAPDIPPDTPWWSLFIRETLTGYAIAVLLSSYVLWSFGRLDGTAPVAALTAIVVLAFPAALGAAAARLIL